MSSEERDAVEEFAEEVGAELVPVGTASLTARYRGYDVYFSGFDTRELDALLDRLEGMGAKPVLKGGTTVKDEQAGETTFDCPMIRFSREDSGRFMIQFFKVLGDGSLSQWPEVKHSAEKSEAWDILEPILTAEQADQLKDLPARVEGEWQVTFKMGRPTGKLLDSGEPSYYKDLIRFELRIQEEE